MKHIALLLAIVMFPLGGSLGLTSCQSMGSAASSAQSWLSDPKNQQLISEIASTAITVIGFLGTREGPNTHATVVGKLAVKYPNVPSGALSQIAAHPVAYAKTPQH